MTLRDLSKRQLYNLRRKCDAAHRKLRKAEPYIPSEQMYRQAFNLGLKSALELIPCPTSS